MNVVAGDAGLANEGLWGGFSLLKNHFLRLLVQVLGECV